MDTSIQNIWRCWYLFRRGKKRTKEFYRFEYELEKNLLELHKDINNQTYRHGPYCKFVVYENKKRDIVVATLRDRVVHRMLYEYLVPIFDKTFIYDVWSCRKGKGLLGAIERTQQYAKQYAHGFVWRTDIKKFFDSVNQTVLMQCIERRITDLPTLEILRGVISSYEISDFEGLGKIWGLGERVKRSALNKTGIPIGNLTSQIFSNMYLNELDRFVVHTLKSKAYLRYGDDLLIFETDRNSLEIMRNRTISFLKEKLFLTINAKNDIIIKPRHGIHFLGVDIFPYGRRLKKRNWKKILANLNARNYSSYLGLVKKHSNRKRVKMLNWMIEDISEGNMV